MVMMISKYGRPDLSESWEGRLVRHDLINEEFARNLIPSYPHLFRACLLRLSAHCVGFAHSGLIVLLYRRLGTVGSGTNEPMRVRPLPIPSVPSASSGTSALMKKKEPTTSRGRPIRLLPPMVMPIFLLLQWDFRLGYSLKLRKFRSVSSLGRQYWWYWWYCW